MSAVMLSIRPEWCAKILSGEKTIEIRKTKPRLETPFKCYIYCTKDNKAPYRYGLHLGTSQRLDGKVVAEFTCEKIPEFYKPQATGAYVYQGLIKKSCVSAKQIADYANGKNVFGWCISDLKEYEKPLPIDRFMVEANQTYDCPPLVRMKHPPQSWCYVEELKDESNRD